MDEQFPLMNILLRTLIALTAVTALAGNAWAATDKDGEALLNLERKLFFTTYPKEEVTTRLSRLEKRVYGDELDGSLDERLSRLVESQKAAIDPIEEAHRQAPAAPEEQASQPSRPPIQTVARTTSIAPTEPDDQDCAIDRARIAARAAKDEEINSLLSAGVELWRNKRGQEAIEKFEQVVRLDPNNAQAHFSMGIIEESQGNFVEAAGSYRKAVKASPRNAEYKDALAAAEKKASSKTVSLDKHSELSKLAEEATAAFKRGEYLSALDLYKQLDHKAPHQSLVKYNIGTIYLVMKQPERALDFYKEAHKLSPSEPRYTKAFEDLQAVVSADQNAIKRNNAAYKQEVSRSPARPQMAPLSASAMASFGILGKSHADGVMVTTVGLASRALKAGLQNGDIIKAVDGTVVTSTKELNDALSHKTPGQPVQMMVQRSRTLSAVTL